MQKTKEMAHENGRIVSAPQHPIAKSFVFSTTDAAP